MNTVRKHTQNKIIDLVSFISMILLIGTGVIMYWVLPPGSHGENFLSLSRHDWGDIHFWIAVVFTVLVAYHLLLHLPWIKGSYFSFGNKSHK
ncbi:DUF4405 domain-containing protein [Gracilimonas mengyeensis]|uniref:Flavinylation-associated cytochrome domain-containing protein n=1 Tax=Gracilimonas mengyeensis TaxID=1302730 RepID=A0A521DVN5_9BACT|nr:protein of unknown function [Gracilimonas mengyeensis]